MLLSESEQRSGDKHWTDMMYLLVPSIMCYMCKLTCEIICVYMFMICSRDVIINTVVSRLHLSVYCESKCLSTLVICVWRIMMHVICWMIY